tara:strand:+ start:469 stop:642 length:174 start_codon:yes stop_codon:yes gene_type:complete
MTFNSFQQYCFASAQNKEKAILKWLMTQTAFKAILPLRPMLDYQNVVNKSVGEGQWM